MQGGSQDALTKVLISLGIIEIRNSPWRIVTFVRTFQHPETNKTVTVTPMPNVAGPSFWDKTLPRSPKFDKIVYEDGLAPAQQGSTQFMQASLSRLFFPFARPQHLVDSGYNMNKFVGTMERDVQDTEMAKKSTLEMMQPPVDPRARRGLEHVDSFPDGTKVDYPWHNVHTNYLQSKLTSTGYNLILTEELVVLNGGDMALMFVYILCLFIMNFLVINSVLTVLFGPMFKDNKTPPAPPATGGW